MKSEESIFRNKLTFFKWINVHFLLVSISLTTAICFRLKDIDRDIVIQDEATSVVYFILPSLKSFSFMDYFMPNNHIFHSILANLSVQIFGNNEIVFRLPVLISGILAVGFIYWWAYKIYGSKEVAFICSFYLALSPIHITFSQTARGYSLIILFSILAQLSLYKLLENFKIRWKIVFIVSSILNVITIPSSSYFVVSQFLSLIVIYLIFKLIIPDSDTEHFVEKISIRSFVYYSFIVFLAIFLFYFPILDQMQAQVGIEGHFLLKNIIPPLFKYYLFGLPNVMLLIFLYGCWTLCIKRNFWGSFSLLVFILPIIISVGIGIGGPPRVYLFCFPFFILAFAIGIYEIVNSILKFSFAKIAYYSQQKKIAALFATLLFSIPMILFLVKNYYPQYHSYKHKKLKNYVSKLDHKNNIIFRPGSLQFNYYLGNLTQQSAMEIMHMNKINNIYLIKGLKIDSNDFIDNYIYNLSKDNYVLLKDFKDNNFDKKYDCIYDCSAINDHFSLYKLQPSNIRKLITNNFLKTDWIQSEGSQKVHAAFEPDSNQIEISIDKDINSSLQDMSFIYSNSTIRLKADKKGFIVITYALTYPNIATKFTFEPAVTSILIKDRKSENFIGQAQYIMNKRASGFDFSENRLWYIMQKIVPLEKGDHDLKLGFFVRPTENSKIGQQKILVRSLQAYAVEF